MRFAIFLLALPCWAVTNSLTITDTTGSTQTNRPFSISRVFKQGEIAAFAQPRVGGVALTTWQCDKKTSWGDGSLSHAIISFTATVTGNGTITVDFINNANPSSAGNQSATNAAALDGTGMLAFNSSAWNAAIITNLTNGGSPTGELKARDVVTAAFFRYWLRGPVVTQVIAEDRTSSFTYDMGLDSNKSIHPYFILTFYAGWAGVKEDFIAENDWTTKLQDQAYTLVLKNGGSLGSTVYTFNSGGSFNHYVASRWRKTYWDGSTPGAVNIDFNFLYMIQTGAVMSYDTTKVVSSAGIADEVADWAAGGGADLNGYGEFQQDFASQGGRPELGVLSRWDARLLFTMNASLKAISDGNGEVGPMVGGAHFRESATGLHYDYPTNTVDAFGKPVSAVARPLGNTLHYGNSSFCASPDCINPIGTATQGNWNPDVAHQAAFSYLSYLLSGDYYLFEEVQFWASFDAMASTPTTDWSTCNFCSPQRSGFMNQGTTNVRGMAWGIRNMASAAFFSLDGSPERTQYASFVNNNYAAWEGVMNITNGNYFSTDHASMWYGGLNYYYLANPNPLFALSKPGYDLCSGVTAECDTSLSYAVWPPWQDDELLVSMIHARNLGLTTGNFVVTGLSRRLIEQVQDPTYDHYLGGGGYYYQPFSDKNGTLQPWSNGSNSNTLWTTWALVKASVPTGYFTQNVVGCGSSCGTGPQGVFTYYSYDPIFGYTILRLGASAFTVGVVDGSFSGAATRAWMAANVPSDGQALQNDNPMWAFAPLNSGAAGGSVSGGAIARGGAFSSR